jgi:hypothetical protein
MKSNHLMFVVLFGAVTIMGMISPPGLAQCLTNTTSQNPNFSRSFRASLEGDLNDYGMIFDDAKRRECSGGQYDPIDGAARALEDKIQATLAVPQHTDAMGDSVGPYRGWLEGAHVTLIFSAALEIGGHGDLKSSLEYRLQNVRDSYVFKKDATRGGCGHATLPVRATSQRC